MTNLKFCCQLMAAGFFAAACGGSADAPSIADIDGTESDAIRNGIADSGKQYPDVVRIAVFSGSTYLGSCTGTIITGSRVLTAGHCLSGATSATVYYDRGSVPGTNLRIHPLFTHEAWYVDQSSIQGGRAAVADGPDLGTLDMLGPIQLIFARALTNSWLVPPGNTAFTVVGYGEASSGDTSPPTRRVGTVVGTTLLPMIRAAMPRAPAGTLIMSPASGQQNLGCYGDSGGPIIDANGKLVAVVSTLYPTDCNTARTNSTTGVYDYESWILETGATLPFHNYKLPADVNDDGFVTTADLQVIINTLNAGGNLSSQPFAYRDVNGDGALNSLDMNAVLVALNRVQASGFTISGPVP